MAMGLTALAACAAVDSGPTVATEYGAVQGAVRHGVREFRGIPFAAAPVGALRWAMPQPPQAWTERSAVNFGPSCAQQKRFDLTQESHAEDCLSLNVSAPLDAKPGEKLPVFFWVHGGAFVGGSSSLYRLDKLAREGRMVVVSANYRLGVFGFMPHPAFDAASNGTLGLEDQRFALSWVQRNIAAFGGDAGNVTIAGESAGAGSICQHLISPERVSGLFHKAIVISGGCLQAMPTVQQALTGLDAEPPTWKKVARSVGCDTDTAPASAAALECMRSKSVGELLTAQGAASHGIMAFGPSTGNATVPRSAADAVASGALARVPLMMGGARDELRLYVAYTTLFPPKEQRFDADTLKKVWLPAFYGPKASTYDAIIAEYGAANGFDGAKMGSMASDFSPLVGINHCLYLKTAQAFSPWVPAIYQFEFADPNAPVLGIGIAKGMDPGFALGAVHSSELNYLFPNLSNTAAIDGPDLSPASQQLADHMVLYWSGFARTGSPAAAPLPAWPRYSGGATVQQLVPGDIRPYDAYAQHRCAFWSRMYP